MMNQDSIDGAPIGRIPADNLLRRLVVADADRGLPHVGVAGNTYTVLLSGEDTAGRYCLIDMHVPPGGGPPPHRHDFEESFTVLEGEIEATFRGEKSVVRAGATVQIPANAPHSFKNVAERPARVLCICSPAGQEEFFLTIGVPVEGRTVAAPKLEGGAAEEMKAKVMELMPKYRTEMVG